MTKRTTRAAARSAHADPPPPRLDVRAGRRQRSSEELPSTPTLLSLPAALLEQVLGLDVPRNCLAATHVNQRVRQVALDSLLRRAADPRTLCMMASLGGTLAVRALLEQGVDVNAPDTAAAPESTWSGMVPLHYAAEQGRAATVQVLLDHGADAGALRVRPYGQQMSALDMAVGKGHCEVVRLLLAAGVSPHPAVHHDNRSMQPLLRAVDHGHLEVVDVLLAAGVDPNHTFPPHSTPLCMAASRGDCDVAASLLLHGADANKEDLEDGTTPLHHAAANKDAAMVRLLLSHGADIEAPGPEGYTPLMFAVLGGHVEIVQAFLAGGSRLDVRFHNDGETLLHYAAGLGHLEVVNALLAAGASCTDCDDAGWMALDMAEEAGHAAVAAALRAAGA